MRACKTIETSEFRRARTRDSQTLVAGRRPSRFEFGRFCFRGSRRTADNIGAKGLKMRSLYRFLLCLHPADFRDRFGDEMLCIFDEAGEVRARTSFLIDATISLARTSRERASRILRS